MKTPRPCTLVEIRTTNTDELNHHRKLPANLFTSPLYVACGATANVIYAGVTLVPDSSYANGGGLVAATAAIANKSPPPIGRHQFRRTLASRSSLVRQAFTL